MVHMLEFMNLGPDEEQVHYTPENRQECFHSQDNILACNLHDFTTGSLTSLSFCRCWPIDLG